MMQAIEEMGELTQAIVKVYRNGLDNERDGLIEELADVQIMIEQLDYLLGDSQINKVKEYKIDRQLNRIALEETKRTTADKSAITK
jgi:NTP pyrophosphatase (non-canonical NTP hydrolase)